ncbi:MAG: hypothetical protein ACI4TH_04720 [Candidatus Ornithomonoglobus sp.]
MKKAVKIPLLLLLVLAVFAGDVWLSHNNFIVNSNIFVQNDFEITQHDHPQKVWDKVFFGNSVVISAYMEDKSSSGYINCGLDDGVVTDLWELINERYMNIGSELVIGLNYLTLYDNFETNPTYIWHKKLYQPYAYFQRDRFYPLITGCFERLINGESVPPMTYTYQKKNVYHGRVADAVLQDKMEQYQEMFFSRPLSDYSRNMEALERVIKLCKDNDIRVRVVWMPWNPSCEKPQLVKDVKAQANEIIRKYNLDVLDLEDEFGEECFYDSGHLNYDVGSERFTKRIDEWL